MNLPLSLSQALQPLFDALPLERAMTQLVVTQPPDPGLVRIVEAIVADPAIGSGSSLATGLWLYVDDLDRSHALSQNDPSRTGSYWHGIMHRREGDFSNSHYWFHRVGSHPAMDRLEGYDAHRLVDDIEAGYRSDPEPLIVRQREEWRNLFEWCATQE